MIRKGVILVSLVGVAMACSNATTGQQTVVSTPPRDGRDLIVRMHDRYAGKWYQTLTFVQKTTVRKPDGAEEVTTWYESLRSPARLRIDFGNPAEGNGVIYTADSLYVVRAGKLARSVANGNPFLPFVTGAYTQPVDSTLRQIAPYHFDLSQMRTDTWNGRPVWVVGANAADDLTSGQFWIDQERLVAVRMIVSLSPAPGAKPFDIRLDDYVPVTGGWLATKVVMMQNGQAVQTEQYSDWKGDVTLAEDFFDQNKWAAAPHWARP